MRTFAFFALALTGVLGCSSGNGNPPPADMSAVSVKDMAKAVFSCCGHPGDTGNSLGVGQFCDPDPCTGSKAIFCASLGGDPNQHFCTFLCHGDGGAAECGENADCQCQGTQCGCYPKACETASAPDGCM
jgi:hypothetical protein